MFASAPTSYDVNSSITSNVTAANVQELPYATPVTILAAAGGQDRIKVKNVIHWPTFSGNKQQYFADVTAASLVNNNPATAYTYQLVIWANNALLKGVTTNIRITYRTLFSERNYEATLYRGPKPLEEESFEYEEEELKACQQTEIMSKSAIVQERKVQDRVKGRRGFLNFSASDESSSDNDAEILKFDDLAGSKIEARDGLAELKKSDTKVSHPRCTNTDLKSIPLQIEQLQTLVKLLHNMKLMNTPSESKKKIKRLPGSTGDAALQ